MRQLKAFINKDVIKRMRHNANKYYYLIMPFDSFYHRLTSISDLDDNIISTGRCDVWLLTADDVAKRLVKYYDSTEDWVFAVIKNEYRTYIDALRDIQDKLESVDSFDEFCDRYGFDIVYGNEHINLIEQVMRYEKH